ncbi:MAG: hypothetical protein KAJ32_02240 [Gammaproteobacteria bacterium]|nr:hypothetical protein [Gammaproteobacteria bacterium]
MSVKLNRSIGIWIVTAVAVLFGLLTIKSGGSVIFIDGADRQAAGNYVPFVVWFNFIAGFVYIIAGAGLWMQKRWAVRLSVIIVIATLIVYVIFGLYIRGGGSYEMRTVIAMVLRSLVWTFIAMFAYRKINIQ